MNCPICHSPLGPDQWHLSAWSDELDERGQVLGALRTLTTHCDFCGVSESVEDHERRVRSTRGPVQDRGLLRRLERRIPACRNDRHVPHRRDRKGVVPVTTGAVPCP